MQKRLIQLCYRKVIDSTSTLSWEQFVFNDTYTEWLMQAQLYNPEKKYHTFAELLANVPGADKLHFLVSAAVVGYLRQLNDVVPDIVNSLNKTFLPFKNFRFEIINSDIRNKAAHQVAINFYSEPILWHDTIDDRLLISIPAAQTSDTEYMTEMLQLQPMLSIYSLKIEDA